MKNIKVIALILAISSTAFSFTFAGNIHTGILYTPVSTPVSPTITSTPANPIGGAYVLPGCTDPIAFNYNKNANISSNTCIYTTKLSTPTSVATATIKENIYSCPFFISYHKKGDVGPEVLKIKTFLNTTEKESLELNNVFDESTRQAVKRFQSKHASQILSPWSLKIATGWWYQSTRKKANDIVGCPEKVRLDNGVLIE